MLRLWVFLLFLVHWLVWVGLGYDTRTAHDGLDGYLYVRRSLRSNRSLRVVYMYVALTPLVSPVENMQVVALDGVVIQVDPRTVLWSRFWLSRWGLWEIDLGFGLYNTFMLPAL